MNPRSVVGIDPSLTGTAVATHTGVHLLRNKLRGTERLVHIRDRVEALLLAAPARLVVIEGYAYGQTRKQSSLVDMGELGGVLRVLFHELGLQWVEVAPGTLKKFATGVGVGDKVGMVIQARERLGYQGTSNDEADALWLREAGLQHYGCSTVRLPKAQVDHINKVVQWP